MATTILRGDCRQTLLTLPENSVHMAVTSPPYWALRSYLKAGDPLKALELGCEPTPEAYLANMVGVFRAVRRVMRDDGTLWVNIGDSYAANRSYQVPDGKWCDVGNEASMKVPTGLKSGDRVGIPERFALAMQADGWWWRDTVIWCLSPSTTVYAKTATTEGPMTIHDLVRLDPATVKLWTGSKWSQVKGWSPTIAEGNTRRLVLRSGEAIGCTDTHQWPLADGRVVRAGELKVGDVLATCRLPDANPCGTDIPDDLAWFAGLYLAEGSTYQDAIRIAGHTKEWPRHSRLANLVSRYGGSSVLHSDGNTSEITIHGGILHGALAHFIAGKDAHTKHVHPRCWALSNKTLSAFLDGYLDGDGHYDAENDRWRLGFCRNSALASDLRTVCARLGYALTLNPTYSKAGRAKVFESYRGEIRKVVLPHHNNRARSEIVKIECGWAGTYYDIGIEDEPHLFALASGVLTHNSKPAPMPSSVNGWRYERCRVKTARGQYANETHPDSYKGATPQGGKANRHAVGGEWIGGAEWSPCPGCPKCRAHNGWVLRKGSWRTTAAHEYIYLFTKTDSYFCDAEAVKQLAIKGNAGSRFDTGKTGENGMGRAQMGERDDTTTANPRSVWTIGPQPCRHKHYAAYPEELPRRVIQAGTPDRGCCPACGAPWARMVERETGDPASAKGSTFTAGKTGDNGMGRVGQGDRTTDSRTVGWLPTCDCAAAEPVPCTVLDPFGGSGTTAIAAEMMGRNAILCELNPEYVDIMAARRAETAPLLLAAQ